MFYDGPPGMMLDLVGPSPDGVDLEWSHPYSYAYNNPLRYVDPSGLVPSGLESHPVTACNGKGGTCTIGRLYATSFYHWEREVNNVAQSDATGIGFSIFLTIDPMQYANARKLGCACCQRFEFIQVLCQREQRVDLGTAYGCGIDREMGKPPYYRFSSSNRGNMTPPITTPPTYPSIALALPANAGQFAAALFDRPERTDREMEGRAGDFVIRKSWEVVYWACPICVNLNNTGKDVAMMPCVRHSFVREAKPNARGVYVAVPGVVRAEGPKFVEARSRISSIAGKEGVNLETC